MSFKDLIAQERIEDEGAWLPLPCGGEMLITYMGNPDFLAKQRRLVSIYRKQNPAYRQDTKEIPPEDAERIARMAMVGTVCKRIRDVPKDDSEMFPDNEDSIAQLLDGSRKVRVRVLQYAQEEETFLKENLDLIQGNSETPSGGSSSGGRSQAKSSKG